MRWILLFLLLLISCVNVCIECSDDSDDTIEVNRSSDLNKERENG